MKRTLFLISASILAIYTPLLAQEQSAKKADRGVTSPMQGHPSGPAFEHGRGKKDKAPVTPAPAADKNVKPAESCGPRKAK